MLNNILFSDLVKKYIKFETSLKQLVFKINKKFKHTHIFPDNIKIYKHAYYELLQFNGKQNKTK